MIQVRFHFLLPALCLVVATAAGCSSSGSYASRGGAEDDVRPVALKGEGSFFGGQIGATLTVSRGFDREKRVPHERPDLIDIPDPDAKDYAENMSKIMALQIRGSPLPPVVMQLSLANHGEQPAEVEITDLNSDLGNFAVRPDHLTIAAGKTAEPDPVHSSLGVTSEEIPVTVGLRVGTKTESHVILVKSLFTPSGQRK